LNQRVIKLVPKEGYIKEFVLQVFKNESFLQKLYSIPGGTKQANLSTKDLKEIKISFPKLTE
jgi:type I restriction enzyme S subunit